MPDISTQQKEIQEQDRKKKGGRPPKDEAEKRKHKVQTNLNEAELKEFKKKVEMSGHSQSEYVRRAVMKTKINTTTATPRDYKKLRADLGRTMSNINQIAKAVNQEEVNDLADTNFRELINYLFNRLEEI